MLTIVFIILTSGFLWASVELSTSSVWIAQTVLSVTLLLLFLQLAVEQLPPRWWSREPADPAPQADRVGGASANGTGALIPALTWMVALPLAVWLFGTAIGAGLFCLAWMRWHSGERWMFSSVFSLALGMGTQLLFGVLLRAELATGIVLQLFS